jgi:hypothetical protein
MFAIWVFVMRESASLIPINLTWKNKKYKYAETNNVHIIFFYSLNIWQPNFYLCNESQVSVIFVTLTGKHMGC